MEILAEMETMTECLVKSFAQVDDRECEIALLQNYFFPSNLVNGELTPFHPNYNIKSTYYHIRDPFWIVFSSSSKQEKC